MKRIFTLIVGCLLAVLAFAQFGGGSGTESDPYRIYNIEHWNEFTTEYNDPQSVYGDFSGIHLRLMDDIMDTVRNRLVGLLGINDGIPYGKYFNGHLHGGGHILVLSMPLYAVPSYAESPHSYLERLGEHGIIDSINFRGEIKHKCMKFIIGVNYGRVSHCSMDFDASDYLPEDEYCGMFGDNYGIVEYVTNYTQTRMGNYFFGIGFYNGERGNVSHCINYADLNPKEETVMAAGILCQNYGGVVEFCMNVGNMNNAQYDIAGILLDNSDMLNVYYDSVDMHWVYDTIVAVVRNCINLGNLQCVESNYDVKGTLIAQTAGGIIINCLNAGNANGYITGDGGLENDTLPIGLFDIVNDAMGFRYTVKNCLNIGNTSGVFIDYPGNTFNDNILRNNYYDKQMCGGFVNDTVGAIESRLTSQLTGDTPELRAMLGDGWSYAEGRYPIPLGFENDSIALRAATPIFLHAESDDDYEHIDSVASNFTVSTANGTSWTTVAHNVEISGENATLRYVGGETLKTRYSNLYEKQIRLNIVNVPVFAETIDLQDIDVYPNPVGNTLNITSSETISEIEIVNVMGQVVYRAEANSNNAVCDVEDLKAGVYIVRIHGKNTESVVSQRKFIKE
jgi:hypothetical protein